MIARTVATMAERPDAGRRRYGAAASGGRRSAAATASFIAAAGLVEAAEAWRAFWARTRLSWRGAIAVNRFADFDESDARRCLTGWRGCNEVAVALTWEKGFAPTRALDATVERLGAPSRDGQPRTRCRDPSGELSDLLCSPVHRVGGPSRPVGRSAWGLPPGARPRRRSWPGSSPRRSRREPTPSAMVVAFPRLDAVAHRLGDGSQRRGCRVRHRHRAPGRGDIASGARSTALLTLAQGAGDRTTALGVLLGPHSDIAPGTVAELDRDVAAVPGRVNRADSSATSSSRSEASSAKQRALARLLRA